MKRVISTGIVLAISILLTANVRGAQKEPDPETKAAQELMREAVKAGVRGADIKDLAIAIRQDKAFADEIHEEIDKDLDESELSKIVHDRLKEWKEKHGGDTAATPVTRPKSRKEREAERAALAGATANLSGGPQMPPGMGMGGGMGMNPLMGRYVGSGQGKLRARSLMRAQAIQQLMGQSAQNLPPGANPGLAPGIIGPAPTLPTDPAVPAPGPGQTPDPNANPGGRLPWRLPQQR